MEKTISTVCRGAMSLPLALETTAKSRSRDGLLQISGAPNFLNGTPHLGAPFLFIRANAQPPKRLRDQAPRQILHEPGGC